MPPYRIPMSDKIIFLPSHIGDYEIDYSQYPEIDDTISQEDVVIVGPWEDFSGSGTIGPQEVLYQGLEDVCPGSLKGQVEQSDIKRTDRGHKSSNKRQRKVLKIINI